MADPAAQGRRSPQAAGAVVGPPGVSRAAPCPGGGDTVTPHRPQPARRARSPKTTVQEMSFLSHEEVAAVADAIDERYRAFVLVAAYCGLRAGEVRGLRRRDVDLLHRTITVTQQLVDAQGGGFDVRQLKTKRSRRSVAVPPHVAKVLATHLGDDGFAQPGADGLVFTSALRRPAAPRELPATGVDARMHASWCRPRAHPRPAPHLCVAGDRIGRRRAGPAAHARPRVGRDDARSLRPPDARAGGGRRSPSERGRHRGGVARSAASCRVTAGRPRGGVELPATGA